MARAKQASKRSRQESGTGVGAAGLATVTSERSVRIDWWNGGGYSAADLSPIMSSRRGGNL